MVNVMAAYQLKLFKANVDIMLQQNVQVQKSETEVAGMPP
jgi:hypothetical protein